MHSYKKIFTGKIRVFQHGKDFAKWLEEFIFLMNSNDVSMADRIKTFKICMGHGIPQNIIQSPELDEVWEIYRMKDPWTVLAKKYEEHAKSKNKDPEFVVSIIPLVVLEKTTDADDGKVFIGECCFDIICQTFLTFYKYGKLSYMYESMINELKMEDVDIMAFYLLFYQTAKKVEPTFNKKQISDKYFRTFVSKLHHSIKAKVLLRIDDFDNDMWKLTKHVHENAIGQEDDMRVNALQIELNKALKDTEAIKKQMSKLERSNAEAINAMQTELQRKITQEKPEKKSYKSKQDSRPSYSNSRGRGYGRSRDNSRTKDEDAPVDRSKMVCNSCGNTGHGYRQCQVFIRKMICEECQKPGHLSFVCKSKNK